MKSSEVRSLNRRLGDALGYVRGGTQPRFQWMWAPDIPYWSTRLGRVWVLCQWRRPGMSPADWDAQFGDRRIPYPAQGMHHAHPETALPPGEVPTIERTQFYIRMLDEQMSATFTDQLCAIQNEIAEDKQRDDTEWVEYVQNTNPAFSNFAPGARGGHVSYGGLKQ